MNTQVRKAERKTVYLMHAMYNLQYSQSNRYQEGWKVSKYKDSVYFYNPLTIVKDGMMRWVGDVTTSPNYHHNVFILFLFDIGFQHFFIYLFFFFF